MNRTDFLMNLYDALEGLPNEVRTDIISEYQDYFKTEEEQGRTQENITASLGDPVALAHIIKSRRQAPPNPAQKNTGRKRSSFGRIVAIIITVMIIMGVISGVSTTVIMAVRGGWGNMLFGMGTKYDVNEVKEINWDNAMTIEIHTTQADTTLFTVSSEKVKAALTGSVKTTNPDAVPTLEISQSGDVISIVEKRKALSIIGFYSSNLKLDISMPESFKGQVVYDGTSGDFTTSNLRLKNLHLSLSSGDVKLENLVLEEELLISSTSSNTKIQGLEAQAATIKATSGDMEFRNFSVSEDIEIVKSSGNTRLDNLSCSQMRLESTSGDTSAIKSKADLFSVTNISGNVSLKDLDGAARIKTTSGNIEVLSQIFLGEFNLSSISGNIKLSIPSGSGFDLEARSTSGDISCAFNLDRETSKKRHLQGIHGTGEVPVNLTTTSGNIQILER